MHIVFSQPALQLVGTNVYVGRRIAADTAASTRETLPWLIANGLYLMLRLIYSRSVRTFTWVDGTVTGF